MKFTSSVITMTGLLSLVSGAPFNETSLVETGIVDTGLEKRCCSPGCYSVKIETHIQTDCSDGAFGASIANWGDKGGCIDTYNGHNYLLGLNDGCTQSNPTLACYTNYANCNADVGAILTATTPGSCFIAPPNCPYLRAVSN